MRQAFLDTLLELARQDRRIVFLTADLGFMAVEPLREAFPDRFLNVGVAEQNMVGIATGLAEAGFLPFVYSIGTFASMRDYEFIRNGPVLHKLPVRIIGVGAGFEYGSAGPTHHAIEDLGIMRLHPDLCVVAPADAEQTKEALRQTFDLDRPVYYRLGKDGRQVVAGLKGEFRLGRLALIGEGTETVFLATGAVAVEACRAAAALRERGVETSVGIVSSFNPSPIADLASLLSRTRLAISVEAHYVTGGLGSLAAEVIAENGLGCRLVRCGVRQGPGGPTGSDAYMKERHRLDQASLEETALTALAIA